MSIVRRTFHLLTSVAALAMLAAAPARAEVEDYDAWHNGSKMRVVVDGSAFTITYETPKRSLRKHGVRSGTVSFSGELHGRTV